VYLVLEFVEGVPLSSLIDGGPVDVGRVLDIAQQVAAALEAAHAGQIVHRDLKPDNLLLVETDGDGDFVKVLDFGIAKVPMDPNDEGKPITQVGMVYGTPEYMAPEQALGQHVDGRADLYALGVIMFELLTGRRPYVGPAVGLLGQQLTSPLPKMAAVAQVAVPPAVEHFVVELLATNAEQRVESAAVAHDQLSSLYDAWREGRLTRSGKRASGLLSVSLEEVTSRLHGNLREPVARVVKSRLSRAALLALAFGALGVISAIVIVGTVTGGSAEPEPLEGEVAAPPAQPEVPDDSTLIDRRLVSAREQGLAGLRELAKEFPAEGSVHAELSLALAKDKQYQEAVDSARVALALDPKLNENPKIAGALFRSAQSAVARQASFRLLKGAMGTAGANIIFDLAHMPGLNAQVTMQAKQLLETDEVRAAAEPPLLLALDLEKSPDCERAKELVKSAALVGDKRALGALKVMKATSGCGEDKKEDCFACLRNGDDLAVALEKIQQRATLQEPSK
jgi:serine/threonine-protein kinase